MDTGLDGAAPRKRVRDNQPIQRLGSPGEIVDLMAHLSNENAGHIAGQCYLINGGSYFL